MKIGQRIQKLRKERKFTQEEIADKLNISQRAYSKIENEVVQLKMDRLQKIAEILEVEPKMLLSDSKPKEYENIDSITKDKMKELYERIISKQEEEIIYLKGIVDIFKK